MAALAWVAVAAVIIVPPLLVAWSIHRAATDGDDVIARLERTEGDG